MFVPKVQSPHLQRGHEFVRYAGRSRSDGDYADAYTLVQVVHAVVAEHRRIAAGRND
jgi:hypothetical protein